LKVLLVGGDDDVFDAASDIGVSKVCDHETVVPVFEGVRPIVKRYLGSETC